MAETLSRNRERLIRRLRNRRFREREALFLVEGVRGCREALTSPVEVRFAVCSPRLGRVPEGKELLGRLREGVEVLEVDDDALEALSDTEAPQGCLLVCVEPAWTLGDLDDVGRLLVLDAVQDPGNVGTLVRAARAMGVGGAIALDGTADPWSPKAVRAAAGASLELPVVRAPWGEVAPWMRGRGTALLAADASGRDVAGVVPGAPWALALGSEGSGVRPELMEAADVVVAVPMMAGAESLNVAVAGALLLYSLTRGDARA